MAHLTQIFESRTEVYELEANAEGFWTKPMGYCSLVVFLWDANGTYYGAGRGQHCSGGLGAAQMDKLLEGLVGKTDVIMVVVQGNTDDPLSMDKEMLKDLQTACRKNNWTIYEYKADTTNSVVTRYGKYLTKEDFDSKVKKEANNIAKSRCVIM